MASAVRAVPTRSALCFWSYSGQCVCRPMRTEKRTILGTSTGVKAATQLSNQYTICTAACRCAPHFWALTAWTRSLLRRQLAEIRTHSVACTWRGFAIGRSSICSLQSSCLLSSCSSRCYTLAANAANLRVPRCFYNDFTGLLQMYWVMGSTRLAVIL